MSVIKIFINNIDQRRYVFHKIEHIFVIIVKNRVLQLVNEGRMNPLLLVNNVTL